MRQCQRCKENKEVICFAKARRVCKDCIYKQTRNRYSDNYRKGNQLKSKYGITLEQYNKMLEQQAGVCKICKKKDEYRELCVDHNHNNGKIRGILCNRCNRAVGMLNDDPKLLAIAINYLLEAL